MEDLHAPSPLSDDPLIEESFARLLDAYLHSNHRQKTEIITRAFQFAEKAHRGVKRRSGEPYIMHPLAVAQICCSEIGLGSTSICAALLHDVVEDTEYTIDDIRHNFGDKIASIVEGLTKISGGIFGQQASTQTENFRRLLLTMAEDIRVILIKMADRLHNMRTLEAQPASKQYKIAGETLYLYAPLAHRLGLNQIKTELEDLSFRYEHPQEYEDIEIKLKQTAPDRERLYQDFTGPLLRDLNDLGITYTVKDRVKSVYSIWNKMQNKHLDFEEIYDVLAVRIIFDTPKDMDEKAMVAWEKKKCWDIYATVTNLYKPHPDRLRDWVNNPKANGYQALHTTVMASSGVWVEVQIRSSRMDVIAERGFAAHWKYKVGEANDENELNHWILTIKEILESPEPNALDMLDTIKMNLFSSEIFVFTPKGDIKTMAQGATVLDFAFELHSELGFHCIGAKVNHQLVPMSYVLKSGDQVEIITSDTQSPKYEWLKFVSTGKAYTRIKLRLRRQNRQLIAAGEEKLTEFLGKKRISYSSHTVERLIQYYGCENRDDLLLKINSGEIDLEAQEDYKDQESSNILVRYFKKAFGIKSSAKPNPEEEPDVLPKVKVDTKRTYMITEEDLHGRFVLSSCCQPIPGDEVLGFVERDGTISIHKQSCPEAMRLKTTQGNRVVNAQWATRREREFPVNLEIRGVDQVGVVNRVTRIVSEQFSVNITLLHITSKDGVFKGYISLNVHDVDDLNRLISEIKDIEAIDLVARIDKEDMVF